MFKKVLTVMAAFLLITGFTIGCEPPEDPGYGEQPDYGQQQQQDSGSQDQTAPGGGGAEGF
ncbi:MAG: hypothetical protein R6U29_10740 [Desulfosudaceae bacterium]